MQEAQDAASLFLLISKMKFSICQRCESSRKYICNARWTVSIFESAV